MEVLASCSLSRYEGFNGKLSVKDAEGKDVKVSLNVVIDEPEENVWSRLKGIEKCTTFKGIFRVAECPMEMSGKVFNEYTLEEIDDLVDVKGVVNLLRLPEGYCDMRTVFQICEKYPEVRVIGGNLLNIDGIRIGRYDSSKPVICNGVYDTFIEADIDSLDNIQEKLKKVKCVEKKEREKSHVEKKVSKKVVAFNNLFGGSEEEF